MTGIWTMGELLAEIMRPRKDMGLGEVGEFLGPFPSGAPGIFIDTVARLGHIGAIVSGVGDDAFGHAIVERLRRDGVRTDLVGIHADRATGVAFVTVASDGARAYIFHWAGTPAVMARAPKASQVAGASFFHVMGCSLMADDAFREQVFAAVELFAGLGARITFDPNIRTELLAGRGVESIVGPVLRRCSILFPGEQELLVLAGERDVDAAVAAMFARYPLEMVVVKHGPRGCSVHDRDGRVDVPPFAVAEVDPIGAGDAFDAGFLCGLLEGRDVVLAARIAAAAGALNASAFGPMEGPISRERVATLMGEPLAPTPAAGQYRVVIGE
jgi:sugar/nucleoside kinase (ribokinase family)